MGGFTAGLVAGCLLGVSGTFFLLSISVAFSEDRGPVFRLRSVTGTFLSIIVLFIIAAFCHRLAIGKDATILMLLFAILAISRIEGLVNGYIATAIGAVILVVWFFPPIGSLMIKSSSDRLALALFLLIATLGSRLIRGRQDSLS
jgi:K+-sensing histidine kinase KdpD